MTGLSRLQQAIARHSGEGFCATAIPRLALMRSEKPSNASASVFEAWLLVVAQGSVRMLLGTEHCELAAGHYAVTTIDLPLSGRIHQASAACPYLGLALSLQPAMLADVLLQMGEQGRDLRPSAGMASGVLCTQLLDPLTRLLELLEKSHDIAMLAPLIEREVLYRLLCGPQGAMLRQLALADSRLSRISRAIARIRGTYTQPLRVGSLAHEVGMSPSSLHRHFKAVTGISPLQYQKRLRLQEAHRRLANHQDSAARIAFAVGYESASQFSRDYRSMFGIPPARDAARLRHRLLHGDRQD